MNEPRKKLRLVLLIFIILFCVLSFQTPALAFSLNPVPFLQKTASVVVSRVSDLVYYLIMQKRYIFNNFNDPNIYYTLTVPENVEKILASSSIPVSSPDQKGKENSQPVSVTTSTLPDVKKTKVVTVTPAPISQTSAPVPILINTNITEPVQSPEPEVDWPVSLVNEQSDSQILLVTNQERAGAGLSGLTANSVLDQVAAERADDLFANQYFEHDSPDGKSASDLARKDGYEYKLIGENLALGNFEGEKAIVSAWMESPGHRANILNDKYMELGVSVKEGNYKGDRVTIAVQIFGLPLSNCPKPAGSTKDLIDSSTASIKKMQADALIMYNNLLAIKNTPGVDRSYYNQKISEYNYFARQVNDAVIALKAMIDKYNLEVSRFNACAQG